MTTALVDDSAAVKPAGEAPSLEVRNLSMELPTPSGRVRVLDDVKLAPAELGFVDTGADLVFVRPRGSLPKRSEASARE